MKATVVIGAALLAAACAGPPHPGPGGPRGPRTIEDGVPAAKCLLKPLAAADGSLTRAQLDADVDRIFAAADLNGDGWLDRSEIRALNEARRTSCDRTPVIDYSATGRIDRHSFGARYVTTFVRADTDQNGALTPAELDTALRPPPLPSDPEERRRKRLP
jgi:hypothetical protein